MAARPNSLPPPTAPDAERYVRVRAPRCPGCQSRDLLPYKTLKPGDGSVSRYTQCRECGRRFIVVVE